MIYHIIMNSDKPMCFDEIERAAQRARGHEVSIDPGLNYLTENNFVSRTERNGIIAYDLNHRITKPEVPAA